MLELFFLILLLATKNPKLIQELAGLSCNQKNRQPNFLWRCTVSARSQSNPGKKIWTLGIVVPPTFKQPFYLLPLQMGGRPIYRQGQLKCAPWPILSFTRIAVHLLPFDPSTQLPETRG